MGLPVAHGFSLKYDVVGFDICPKRVALLQQGIDPTGEVPVGGLKGCNIEFTTDAAKLGECKFIVVAVPTPVDRNKRPDLTPLVLSSTTVGKYMPKGAVVVYESTVAPGRFYPDAPEYKSRPVTNPGVTEDECVPLLEKHSGMQYRRDFRVGYSPERISLERTASSGAQV